jgi:DNA-binding XRE family transcriptional regulator
VAWKIQISITNAPTSVGAFWHQATLDGFYLLLIFRLSGPWISYKTNIYAASQDPAVSLSYACSMRRPRPQNFNHLWIARKKAGLPQKSVARLLGHKGTSVISEYETGRLLPSLRTAFKLAAIYQAPLSELYAGLFQEVQSEVELARKSRSVIPNLAPIGANSL